MSVGNKTTSKAPLVEVFSSSSIETLRNVLRALGIPRLHVELHESRRRLATTQSVAASIYLSPKSENWSLFIAQVRELGARLAGYHGARRWPGVIRILRILAAIGAAPAERKTELKCPYLNPTIPFFPGNPFGKAPWCGNHYRHQDECTG